MRVEHLANHGNHLECPVRRGRPWALRNCEGPLSFVALDNEWRALRGPANRYPRVAPQVYEIREVSIAVPSAIGAVADAMVASVLVALAGS